MRDRTDKARQRRGFIQPLGRRHEHGHAHQGGAPRAPECVRRIDARHHERPDLAAGKLLEQGFQRLVVAESLPRRLRQVEGGSVGPQQLIDAVGQALQGRVRAAADDQRAAARTPQARGNPRDLLPRATGRRTRGRRARIQSRPLRQRSIERRHRRAEHVGRRDDPPVGAAAGQRDDRLELYMPARPGARVLAGELDWRNPGAEEVRREPDDDLGAVEAHSWDGADTVRRLVSLGDGRA